MSRTRDKEVKPQGVRRGGLLLAELHAGGEAARVGSRSLPLLWVAQI
jgi:hypothetical protein